MALEELGGWSEGLTVDEPVAVETRLGPLTIVPTPAGTGGYDDLRRAATREPLGRGVPPAVASKGDLARMLAALDREEDAEKLRRLHRLIELERDVGLGVDIGR